MDRQKSVKFAIERFFLEEVNIWSNVKIGYLFAGCSCSTNNVSNKCRNNTPVMQKLIFKYTEFDLRISFMLSNYLKEYPNKSILNTSQRVKW